MECVECRHQPEGAGLTGMGSVGSGVSSQQDFALRSVGTRTQSSPPRGPCRPHQASVERGCSGERPQPPLVPDGTERPPTNGSESSVPNGDQPVSKDELAVSSSDCTVSTGNQLVINATCMNGLGRRAGRDICGNSVVMKSKKNVSQPVVHCRDTRTKLENNNNPPRIQPVSSKEEQVLHMRRNLDQSEVAIAQVFEEKQRVWEREMDELRQNYAGRLQQVSRKALRSQHALQAQVARLQQDKRRLQDEITALLSHREELERKCLDYRKQQADILPRLEETKWEVCQKVGEISLLKQQLRESQGEVTQRAGETVALRAQLKELSAQLKEKEETALSLKGSYRSKSLQLEHCEGELQRTLREVSQLRDKLGTFEAEVEGLRRALGKVSRGVGRAWGGLPSSQSPSEAAPPPSSSAGDPLLSLQSDEAKAQRQWEDASDLQQELERLQGALRLERQQREQQALSFAQERHSWLDEKQRVLQYQAQLQLSYVELLQKNQALERQVGRLGTRGPSSPSPSLSPPGPSGALPASPSSNGTNTPALQQLTPTWPANSRLERIESTEI